MWCNLPRACWKLVVCVSMVSTIAGGSSFEIGTGAWEDAPRVDLVCRSFGDAVDIFWRIFMPTYLLFWPISAWTSSGLVVVLDGDSPGDHLLGTLLQNLKLPSKIEVKYEAPAPNGTLCSDWRREGYARQQWSNFYADLYSDADFLAVVDTDAAFIAPVIVEDLFKDGKPKAKGLNLETAWENNVTAAAIGGHPSVGRFMSKISFPVLLKSSHLQDMRKDITANLGASTFEEAFHMICSAGKYSQFEIMMNYLWYYKREEYSWHIADPTSGDFSDIAGRRQRWTDDRAVVATNTPTMMIMNHAGKAGTSLNEETYANLCIGSNYEAGDCGMETGYARSPEDGAFQTRKWSVGRTTWEDAHKRHVGQVSRAREAFRWRREDSADYINIGQ